MKNLKPILFKPS